MNHILVLHSLVSGPAPVAARPVWPDLIRLMLGAALALLAGLWLPPTPAAADSPTFAAKVDFTTGASPQSLAVGDINGDGKPDLVTANFQDRTVSVLLNTTAPGAITPTFATRVDFDADYYPEAVVVADLNDDGKLDLATANGPNLAVSVLLNTTASEAITPTFAARVTFNNGSYPYAIAVGDINGDGKPDLATANYQGGKTVSVLRNTTASGATTPTFAAKVDFTIGYTPRQVAVADLNDDGKPDLVTANGGDNDSVAVLRNTTVPGATDLSFADAVTFGSYNTPNSVVVADLNDDGKPDLVTPNLNYTRVAVLRNTTDPGAAPTFADAIYFTTNSYPYAVAAADLTGDGKPDLGTANKYSDSISVLRNTTAAGAVTPTFAPKVDLAASSPYAVAVGDINGDGKPDLATANDSANSVSVLLNTSTADLGLTRTVTPGTARPGQAVTYTMTFGNAGGWPAAGVVITGTVSVPTLTQVSIISSGVAITTTTTAPVYTWQVQDLAPDHRRHHQYGRGDQRRQQQCGGQCRNSPIRELLAGYSQGTVRGGYPSDKHLYKEQYLIECFINKINHYQRVFSRFDKLANRYLGYLSFIDALCQQNPVSSSLGLSRMIHSLTLGRPMRAKVSPEALCKLKGVDRLINAFCVTSHLCKNALLFVAQGNSYCPLKSVRKWWIQTEFKPYSGIIVLVFTIQQ